MSARTGVAGGSAGLRINAAFRLLMQIRMSIAGITLLLLSTGRLSVAAFVTLVCVGLLAWLVARYVTEIVPRLLAHPSLVLLDVAASFTVLAVCGPAGPFFLSTVATAAAAGLLYRWPGMLGVSAAQIACYYLTFAFDAAQTEDTGSFQVLVGQPAYYPLVGFAGVALRRIFEEQSVQEEARIRAEVAAAAAEERARLAREMHDSLAKTLRGIALAAAALPAWARRDPARAAEEAVRIATATEVASREARGLLTELRDTTVTRPLAEAVRAAADRWQAETGIEVRCALAPDTDVPLRTRYEALAVLTEALTNTARHAEAGLVTVSLAEEDGQVVLTIRDDGRGFHPEELPDLARQGHYGLIGMRERAERVGGTVTVQAVPGAGTTVELRLPARHRGERFDNRLAEAS
ncbi:Signal transduction histidine kinase [Thermomonospora echinospora]|uniref:Signal transduction histidine kinase n=1 Tax=Thermomonospora echinospora TaxID=1992 RepID=A0A1H6A6A5_9ACTN|nr:ATP-binding protein [Thermomonospora echinospora]SEG43567.1 Signal transduction histidine kinase [Thermomonospora echinospora]